MGLRDSLAICWDENGICLQNIFQTLCNNNNVSKYKAFSQYKNHALLTAVSCKEAEQM